MELIVLYLVSGVGRGDDELVVWFVVIGDFDDRYCDELEIEVIDDLITMFNVWVGAVYC